MTTSECRVVYWRIYWQIPEIWQIFEALGYKYFGFAIRRISCDFSKAFGSKFFGSVKI